MRNRNDWNDDDRDSQRRTSDDDRARRGSENRGEPIRMTDGGPALSVGPVGYYGTTPNDQRDRDDSDRTYGIHDRLGNRGHYGTQDPNFRPDHRTETSQGWGFRDQDRSGA